MTNQKNHVCRGERATRWALRQPHGSCFKTSFCISICTFDITAMVTLVEMHTSLLDSLGRQTLDRTSLDLLTNLSSKLLGFCGAALHVDYFLAYLAYLCIVSTTTKLHLHTCACGQECRPRTSSLGVSVWAAVEY